jgi:hypothetical protein
MKKLKGVEIRILQGFPPLFIYLSILRNDRPAANKRYSDRRWGLRVEAEGGPYADTLVVELPNDKQLKEKILEIHNNEIEEHGLILRENRLSE